jgi:hypothetical protein
VAEVILRPTFANFTKSPDNLVTSLVPVILRWRNQTRSKMVPPFETLLWGKWRFLRMPGNKLGKVYHDYNFFSVARQQFFFSAAITRNLH